MDAELEGAAHFRASLRRFLRQSGDVMARAGLSPRRFDLLLFVHAAPGHRTTTTALTRQLQLGQPAVTELVKGMAAIGLLRRTQDDLDRRRIWIELTPAGRTLLLACARKLRAARNDLAASFVAAEEAFRSQGD